MTRLLISNFVPLVFTTALLAQSPSPASTPKPAAASPTPAASITIPSTIELIDSLTPADLQAAIPLLKNNFANPDAINDTQLSRATLQGLMSRLGNGLVIVPEKTGAPVEPSAPFYAELLDGHVGYARLGALTTANLQALEKKLVEFGKKMDACVVDLRSSATYDFATAAEFAKRFCPKGKLLFSLRKTGKPDRAFNSDREPAFNGLIVLLADGDTAGSAEAFASALRLNNKALLIGQSSAGRAAEYSDLPLPSGKALRVATSEAVSPDGHSLYPGGVKPDLPVEMSLVDKRQIFQSSMEKGVGPFVYETDRPHLNEAALIAGTNPELESGEQRRTRLQDRLPHDSVLQRALDLVTSLEVYQKR
jgi:hypothetical protein